MPIDVVPAGAVEQEDVERQAAETGKDAKDRYEAVQKYRKELWTKNQAYALALCGVHPKTIAVNLGKDKLTFEEACDIVINAIQNVKKNRPSSAYGYNVAEERGDRIDSLDLSKEEDVKKAEEIQKSLVEKLEKLKAKLAKKS
jgi:hypothetical protein